MARKLLAGILIAFSALFLVASVIGIGAIWYYKGPLTREVTGQLKQVDVELAQAEATLASSEKELQRALRIVDSAQTAMDKLKAQTNSAANFFDTVQSTLDDRLLPELKTTRTRILSARTTLESLQSLLKGVSSFVPGLDLNAPDKVLADLIASTKSLDTEIVNVETMATQASTFVGDTGYLLGGDLTETQKSLKNFLDSIGDYKTKLAGWRQQDQHLLENAPRWINEAAIILTIFLIWFGLSQFGLLLHGLALQRGADPFYVLRPEPIVETVITEEEDIDLELEA
jgi:hypothetical protein